MNSPSPNVGAPIAPALDPDHALVELAKAGDKRAFEMLVIKYQRRLERLIGRMVRDVDLVQDIAQESFIRAYRALGNFRGEAQFYTWLYRIAVNTAKKYLLAMKRDPIITESALRGANDEDDETSSGEHPLNNRIAESETPESTYAAKEIANAVNAAMDALPEELRQAITLRELEGLSYEEISELMDCPIGTVRSRIFRAREAISARIKPMLEKQTGKRW
jgi:RNA polymerase sigma-70 factor, ECF subfamily